MEVVQEALLWLGRQDGSRHTCSKHMEVPRLGVHLELQQPAYTTATATWDPSRVCDPHHSSWQCQILNPLREALG